MKFAKYFVKTMNLLHKIKHIKFIPNYFCLSKNSNRIHEAIYSSSQNHLICLEDSASKHFRDFYWIKKNILPDYCTLALEHNKENLMVAKVHHNLDLHMLVDNLSELCNILGHISILDKHQIKELNLIFEKNFSELHKYLSTPETKFQRLVILLPQQLIMLVLALPLIQLLWPPLLPLLANKTALNNFVYGH